ncbi:hypothetical protein [Caulobacter sp. NIBR1757]|uniref:hypothetical protein n=1 Tax=Caulobacter sp. NIBR1757 TaxID=3016000 RepID=UPI0022F0E750|nr:hypothetical protein [Caulobacter sp. NIBR1757]WGM40148.1 hypothetical protein AMEJIAPC_03089 [Caulobacter sp. NIBR1757]
MSGPNAQATHLYDAVSSQKEQIVDGFAEQREALKKAVEDQRLAAMPEHMRRAALGPSAAVSAEIVELLQRIIAREVTRQLELAVRAMMTQSQAEKAAADQAAAGVLTSET